MGWVPRLAVSLRRANPLGLADLPSLAVPAFLLGSSWSSVYHQSHLGGMKAMRITQKMEWKSNWGTHNATTSEMSRFSKFVWACLTCLTSKQLQLGHGDVEAANGLNQRRCVLGQWRLHGISGFFENWLIFNYAQRCSSTVTTMFNHYYVQSCSTLLWLLWWLCVCCILCCTINDSGSTCWSRPPPLPRRRLALLRLLTCAVKCLLIGVDRWRGGLRWKVNHQKSKLQCNVQLGEPAGEAAGCWFFRQSQLVFGVAFVPLHSTGVTNPNNAFLKGKSPQMTICLNVLSLQNGQFNQWPLQSQSLRAARSFGQARLHALTHSLRIMSSVRRPNKLQPHVRGTYLMKGSIIRMPSLSWEFK